MNTSGKQANILSILGCLLIGVFIVIVTFPDNEWIYSKGIDEPLMWLYNYVFENNLSLGKHIIFPHGPLVFFTYPGQENILLATGVAALLKILLTFLVYLLLAQEKKIILWPATLVVSYGLLIVSGFLQFVLIDILLLYCYFFISGKPVFKILAFLLTAFCLFVKAYVAVISGVFFVSFVAYYFFTSKKIKPVFADGCTLLGFILVFWLMMYKSFNGFFSYLWGLVNLAQDNSSGAAYFPYNNWFLLILFFIALITIFLLNRTPKAIFYFVLAGFSLFAAWKHGMAREDLSHTRSFFVYVMIFLIIFILFVKNKIYINTGISLIACIILFMNLRNAIGYAPWEPDWFRAGYFFEFISDFSTLKENAVIASQQNIEPNKLPEPMRKQIGNASTDVYPWDYSIIAANNLNWQPRVVIQSYAAYTSWLDSMDAAHFNSESAPEYLVWEKDKVTADVNGGDFNSIDSRYLLNDEPRTMLELIRHYDFSADDKKFLVLKKRSEPLSLSVEPAGTLETTWDEWIPVPAADQLLRAKLHFKKTIFESLKSFLYKDEQFWICLKLKSGLIHKYRIVPKNAEDGLWITPYLFDSANVPQVDKIMFTCSSRHLLADKLNISWEKIRFGDTPHRAEQFFHTPLPSTDSLIFYSGNDYENPSLKNWRDIAVNTQTGLFFSGSRAQLLKPGSYSSTFSLSLDSLPFHDLKINTDCQISPLHYKLTHNILLTISIDDEKGNVLWKAIAIDDQIIDENRWNHIYYFADYANRFPHRKLTIYLNNISNENILVDDFRVMIQKK